MHTILALPIAATRSGQGHELIGATGVAMSTLRLSGKARIRGRVYDVMSRTEFLDPGDQLIVEAIEERRVIVIAAPAQPTSEDA